MTQAADMTQSEQRAEYVKFANEAHAICKELGRVGYPHVFVADWYRRWLEFAPETVAVAVEYPEDPNVP